MIVMSDIVLVSGAARSGTSMTMKMLETGGLPVNKDDQYRPPDIHNPGGYYELGSMDISNKDWWLQNGVGKATKCVFPYLSHLPYDLNYKIIWIDRPEIEVVRKAILADPENASLEANRLKDQKEIVFNYTQTRNRFNILRANYRQAMIDPLGFCQNIKSFLGYEELNVENMANVVDLNLWRRREGEI